MNQYQRGDLVRTTATFTNLGGTATDPTTVTATVTNPAGSATAYVYGTDAALVKSATGVYYVDVDANLVVAPRTWEISRRVYAVRTE